MRSLPIRLAATSLAVGLATTLMPATSASAATHKVKTGYFGMTDGDPTSWPSQPVGSVRLWDTGTTWRDIETSPGHFDFSRLDAQVSEARRNGARVLIVLGQTPRFHATHPDAPSYLPAGASSAPKLWAWKRYVRQVASRYKGRHVDYQIWNEANVSGFWSGSVKQMAVLTKSAAKIVNNVDGKAKVVSPALATRLTSQRKWLRTFYATRAGGHPVAYWVDVVSLHLYPLAKQRPEESMHLLDASRIMLGALGVHKPIWNTEINYGLQTGGGGTPKSISAKRQAAYVIRTYVLNASENVKKVFWYSWGLQSLANTRLTFASGSLTKAGRAYGVAQDWLRGARLSTCTRDRRGTYECVAKYSGGVRHIYWNPTKRATITTPRTTKSWTSLTGSTTRIGSGKRLVVNYAPKMVQSRR